MCLGTAGVVTGISDDAGVPMATVRTRPARVITACLLTCQEAAVGDTVLVHCGYVLRILDSEEDECDEQDEEEEEEETGS
jgi:hydrogenase maturation factor